MFEGLHTLQLLLLNANRIECIRTDAFRALGQLNLLCVCLCYANITEYCRFSSLYDNRIQSIANGTFASMKQLQTLYVADACDLSTLAVYHFKAFGAQSAHLRLQHALAG